MSSPLSETTPTPAPASDARTRAGVVWRITGALLMIGKWLFVPPNHNGYKSLWKPRRVGGRSLVRAGYSILLWILVLAFLAFHFNLVPDRSSPTPNPMQTRVNNQ